MAEIRATVVVAAVAVAVAVARRVAVKAVLRGSSRKELGIRPFPLGYAGCWTEPGGWASAKVHPRRHSAAPPKAKTWVPPSSLSTPGSFCPANTTLEGPVSEGSPQSE